jgi:hypothetical protein
MLIKWEVLTLLNVGNVTIFSALYRLTDVFVLSWQDVKHPIAV